MNPETPASPVDLPDFDPFGIVPAFTDLGNAMGARPVPFMTAALSLATASATLPFRVAAAMSGGGTVPEIGKDPRFSDEAWRNNPWHAWLAAQYALARETALATVRDTEGLDAHTQRKVEFFTEQWLDTWSPSNFLGTNPAAILRAWETSGGSLMQGWRNFMDDIVKSAKIPTQSDLSAFQVGRDLATTPGKVVARNFLAEIIQYAPTTPEVHARPLVVVSPWIGKYYILDLNERQSFVKHLVDQGFTVFAISWKNPDASMSETGFADYVEHGITFAKDVAAAITGVPDPVAIGYCIGGASLAATQAWLKASKKPAFHAIGLITAMVDYEECGQIKVFIDERAVRNIERNMARRGYLTSDEMAVSFGTLRARELVWSYFVDNYLLGKTPPPFDLLYWNADGTRMPRAMHSWYLRKLYLENALRVPGAVRVRNVPIDLGRITEDVYLVGTEKDHIAPYPAVYKLHRYIRGNVRFVLASSGHIAGVINAPGRKGWYSAAPGEMPEPGARPPEDIPDVADWVARSERRPGSWWTDYAAWLAPRTGDLVSPPTMGNDTFTPLQDAPGSYVLEK